MTSPPRKRLNRRLQDREAAPLATRVAQHDDGNPVNRKHGPWAGPPGRAGARRRARRKARRDNKQA